ncbi:hypothetical protein DBV05_g11698, partial [Lasiodiplodia theobromae]
APAPTPLLLCFLTIFLKTFALMSYHLYLQYASRTLRWPIASAGYLLSVKAFMSLLVLLVLPLAGAAAARRRVPAVAVDTWVARGSLACLAAGSAMVGWASVFGGGGSGGGRGRGGGQGMAVALVVVGLVLASVGNGITQTMRGLVAHFAQRRPVGDGGGGDNEGERRREGEGTGSKMGQLYAGIALLELIAVLTGEMAFAALFGLGTRLSSGGGEGGGSGSWWVKGFMGLPFYAAAVIFFLGFVCAIRIPLAVSNSRRN